MRYCGLILPRCSRLVAVPMKNRFAALSRRSPLWQVYNILFNIEMRQFTSLYVFLITSLGLRLSHATSLFVNVPAALCCLCFDISPARNQREGKYLAPVDVWIGGCMWWRGEKDLNFNILLKRLRRGIEKQFQGWLGGIAGGKRPKKAKT